MAIQSYKTKDGKRYRASFKFQDARPTRAGFKIKDDARRWITDEKRRLEAEAKAPPRPIRTTFEGLYQEYLNDCRGRMKGLNTVRQKTYVCALFLAYLAVNFPDLGSEPAIDDITRAHIKSYLGAQFDHPELRPHSKGKRGPEDPESDGAKVANRDLRDLKAFYNWAIREEKLLLNSCNKIDPFSEDPFLKYVPPAEHIDKVLMAAQPWEMELLQVYYHTAARLSEVLELTWEDVNMEKRWVRLWTRKRKGGQREPRYLPMNTVLQDLFARKWKKRNKTCLYVFENPRTGSRYSKNQASIRLMMKRLCERAEVPHFGVHAIRHHVASIVQDSKKATLKQIQLFLGHKRQTTTEIYLHALEAGVEEVGAILEERVTGSDACEDDTAEGGK